MSEKGQITTLGNIIHPNVGVVTNVGVSHIEMMGSRDNICIEKLDIQNGLPEDGVLFLNGDNDMIRKHIDYVKKPYEFYGFADDCTYRAEKIREKNGQTLFEFHYGNMKENITLNVLGKHNVSNALAAIAIGLRYDVPMDAIKTQLSGPSSSISDKTAILRPLVLKSDKMLRLAFMESGLALYASSIRV